jgi:hypothetical protein
MATVSTVISVRRGERTELRNASWLKRMLLLCRRFN